MSELTMSLYGTATLGAVIDALKAAPADADVQFDFCYLRPTMVSSYRGYYDHLALGWSDQAVPPSEGRPSRFWPRAADVAEMLANAVGDTFEGWKGGEYRMTRDTPLWVANRGQAGGTGIVGVHVEGDHTVVIKTAKVD